MAAERIARLRAFMQARPEDPFPRYALALEHRNAGDHAAAWSEFERLLADHPDYTAGYLHAGQALVALGQRDQARQVWQDGVQACIRRGDHHARGEIESALATLAA
jgi:tetratricopeptide (TPR) repeat protein